PPLCRSRASSVGQGRVAEAGAVGDGQRRVTARVGHVQGDFDEGRVFGIGQVGEDAAAVDAFEDPRRRAGVDARGSLDPAAVGRRAGVGHLAFDRGRAGGEERRAAAGRVANVSFEGDRRFSRFVNPDPVADLARKPLEHPSRGGDVLRPFADLRLVPHRADDEGDDRSEHDDTHRHRDEQLNQREAALSTHPPHRTTLKLRFAGRSSQTPTWLTALTAKVWRPKESFLNRFGELHVCQRRWSSLQTKLDPCCSVASLKRKTTLCFLVFEAGPKVIVVSGMTKTGPLGPLPVEPPRPPNPPEPLPPPPLPPPPGAGSSSFGGCAVCWVYA